MIKNLVIGGNGFLGSELNKFLIQNGESSSVFGKKNSNEDIRYCKIPASNFDIIYFLAWDFGSSKYISCENKYSEQIKNNLEILTNTIPQLIDSDKKVIFISSFAADNTDFPYGITKKIAEMWMSQHKFISLRLGNIYGKIKKNDKKSDVISDFINQAINNKKIVMDTDGEEKRQFIHYSDAVRIIKQSSGLEIKKIYDTNSNFQWLSILDIAKIISSYTGAEIVKGSKKGIHREFQTKDTIKNFEAKVSIENGILEILKNEQ